MDDTNTNRRSLDLEITTATTATVSESTTKESYRSIDPDEEGKEKSDPEKSTNMVRDNIDNIDDGADEKMLGVRDTDKLANKELEVKFVQGVETNGDAQIDIGDVRKKSAGGMTKEELMKYVNDPFWIRLRWCLFVFFWLLWIAMLVGAIIIIVNAPKCTPQEPHTWFKKGPLILTDNSDLTEPTFEELNDYETYGVTGVIYKLPAGETYNLNEVHKEKIEKLANSLKNKDINLVLDVTANYVNEQDPLYKEAINSDDPIYKDAFIFSYTATPPNWKSLGNQPAFKPIDNGRHVLSQFGFNLYDMRMDNILVKQKFKSVLKTLTEYGVKGFRLDNSKHFIITRELKDVEPDRDSSGFENEYRFYTHTGSVFVEGLGSLLNEYREYVKNITNNEGFLSVTDNIAEEHVYKLGETQEFGIDLPKYGMLEVLLEGKDGEIDPNRVQKDLEDTYVKVANESWIQHAYRDNNIKALNSSEYNFFVFLLPGVPITQMSTLKASADNNSIDEITELEKTRESPSLQFGSFAAYTDINKTAVAYTRYKPGNPGYFVVLNPNNRLIMSNFTHIEGLPSELKVYMLSANYKEGSTLKVKDKVEAAALQLPAKSVGVFSYIATK